MEKSGLEFRRGFSQFIATLMWGQKRRFIKYIPYAAIQYWKHCFHEGQMLLREFGIFSGEFRNCYSSCWRLGKGKCLGSLSSLLLQIIKAFVCLGILPSLCASFCTAPQWYVGDMTNLESNRKVCKRRSGSGQTQSFGCKRRSQDWLHYQSLGQVRNFFSFFN